VSARSRFSQLIHFQPAARVVWVAKSGLQVKNVKEFVDADTKRSTFGVRKTHPRKQLVSPTNSIVFYDT
jgi:hypothetical protein